MKNTTTYTVSALNRQTAVAAFIGTYQTAEKAIEVANSNKKTGYLIHVLESNAQVSCAPDATHETSWSRMMTTEELAAFGESIYTA